MCAVYIMMGVKVIVAADNEIDETGRCILSKLLVCQMLECVERYEHISKDKYPN